MTERLHDRLEAKIGELKAAGLSITCINASASDIEQLFIEGGESAILLDCDPNRDTAWYGDVELHATQEAGTWILATGESGPQRVRV
jgi:hypothetical protein